MAGENGIEYNVHHYLHQNFKDFILQRYEFILLQEIDILYQLF